jgi:5-formyltetrahydrofolate cyclo-ligase
LPAVVAARVVMAYSSVPGEPDTTPFIAWCEAAGKRVVLPESEPPPDPATIDVVVVPGTAFTADGQRLGQGGGWYDRFLVRLDPRCTKIGVGFDPQLVESLPVEDHDVKLDLVVTDRSTVQVPRTR